MNVEVDAGSFGLPAVTTTCLSLDQPKERAQIPIVAIPGH